MIRPLRQRHRITMFALSVILPAGFALGVATRREIPATPASGTALSGSSKTTEIWSRDDLWEKTPIRTRLSGNPAIPRSFIIELNARFPVVRPDLLVYWIPQKSKIQDSLPEDAFLLGSFDQAAPSPLALPAQAADQPGVLALYTLAEHEIVAVSKPFSLR